MFIAVVLDFKVLKWDRAFLSDIGNKDVVLIQSKDYCENALKFLDIFCDHSCHTEHLINLDFHIISVNFQNLQIKEQHENPGKSDESNWRN